MTSKSEPLFVPEIKNEIPADLVGKVIDVDNLVIEFCAACEPLEKDGLLYVFVDAKTRARFCECHMLASKLVGLSTVDVPLDPEEQQAYRANRDLEDTAQAFEDMKDDALARRSFSNIVAEYTTDFDANTPIKIIGGQHRYEAIKLAGVSDIDEYHGLKVYFALTTEQRYDVQIISNTVIDQSLDLLDRMRETMKGPELRNWCQEVGLLESDFSAKRQRGKAITVKAARSFILNYYRGKELSSANFDTTETIPSLTKSGVDDDAWEKLRQDAEIWTDSQLKETGKEFARLVAAQRKAFEKTRKNLDFAEKALNYAVISSWAFVAGLLHNRGQKLKQHFNLANRKGKDPLNAGSLADGKHKTDSESYRGLGYRTDAKERGRFVEVFYLQANRGDGISPALIDLAIKKYHTKISKLEEMKAERVLGSNGGN